jgi:hypothetical protein
MEDAEIGRRMIGPYQGSLVLPSDQSLWANITI